MDSTSPLRQRIYEMLMESQYWPPEQMLAYQRSQLAQLLRHAKATVPFYQKRLDVVFKKNGEIDWDRWNEIPIVTRADLRDRREEMLTTALPQGHGPTKNFSTSGTTGVPITIALPSLMSEATRAAWKRFFHLQNIDSRKRIAEFNVNQMNGTPITGECIFNVGGKEVQTYIDPGGDSGVVISRRLLPSHKLDVLQSLNVAYLTDTSTAVEILAHENLRRKPALKFEAVIGVSMGITDEQRILNRQSFNARTVSAYSSKEGALMAFQCGETTHFHVCSETFFLEVLDEQNTPCAIGQPGRAVITPFFQTAQPLIRYEQGDVVTLGEACSCKSLLPVIARIDGRQDSIFRFPDRDVSATGFDHGKARQLHKATAYQLAQVGPLDIEVRYMCHEDFFAKEIETIVDHLKTVLHPDLQITFKRVADIPFNAGGKQQRIVRELS
jgi:phenylacetate-CoA ligase